MVGLTLVNSVRDFECVYDGMGICSLIMSHQRRHSVQGAFLLCDLFFPVTCSNYGEKTHILMVAVLLMGWLVGAGAF